MFWVPRSWPRSWGEAGKTREHVGGGRRSGRSCADARVRLPGRVQPPRAHRREQVRHRGGISDVVDPNTGDFDGQTILIDHDQDLEVALFVLVHLFGHTVQWNVSEAYRELGLNVAVGKTEEEMAAITEYERGATQLGIALLHEAGVFDMDGWASDWWRADFEYLAHFYRTGEKLDVRRLLKRGGEALPPLLIPAFTSRRFASRWSF